ncbi:T9SS type A sorting domain-containing protein [Winogradskyella sp.]|uniref:T9SS type A sorting domain-containing protein n=1 Tax=Winogradskyella sp. TaxID=1883156 RepID=UPI0025EC2542|nr:T9SS type A sorting domain-containing protein [Winogradskyella sp.]
MKKITLLLFLISSFFSVAQSTCNQTFSATGNDDDPTVLTITAAEINCADPAVPTALTLTNSAGNLTNLNCATNGTSNWYDFTLSITGGASNGVTITGCAGELDGTDITGFTSLTITSNDLDTFSDVVTIEIDVESTFVALTPPNCDSVLDETTDVSVGGDISWSQATGGPSSYDLTVGLSSGAGDVFPTADVGNVTTINLGTLTFGTTYFVTIVPKNANGSATGCVEQTFTTEALPPIGQSCFNPIAATVETDCTMATPNTVDFASSVDVGPYSCDGTTGNNGAWFEFTSSSADGVTISSTDALVEYVVLDDCNGTEIACGTFTGNSAIILLSPNTTFKLAVWKDAATSGTTDICIEEYTLPPAPDCAETPVVPANGATMVDASTGTVTFSWTAPSSGPPPTDYEFFLGTESGMLTSLGTLGSAATTIDIINIAGNDTYYWQVIPLNGITPAVGPCPEWSFTTAPVPPPATIAVIDITGCGQTGSASQPYVIPEITWVQINFAGGCDLTIDTLTSTVGDSEIGLYDSDGNLIGSNDDFGGGLLSSLTVTNLPAGTYYAAAGTFNVTFGQPFNPTSDDTDDTGIIEINVTSSVPNDECADAEAIAVDGTPVNGDNTGATDSMVAGACFTGTISDVWYTFDGPIGEEVFIQVTSGFQFELYSDCGGTLVAGSCNETGAIAVTSGTTYYLRISDIDVTRAPGAFTVQVAESSFSTDGFDNVADFTYYPNPVKNTLSLNAQQNIDNISMFNMLGQEVMRLSPNSVSTEVDMSSLLTGTYFVRVSIEGSTKTVRVIKQ